MTPFSDRSDLARGGEVPPRVDAGSREQALAYLFALLCDPHEEILVPSPGRAPEALAQLWGVHLSRYPLLHERDGWSYDVAAIYEVIGERTRAIVAGNPVEPVGAALDRDAIEALGALEVALIVDESGADVALDEAAIPRVLAGAPASLAFAIDAGGAIEVGGPEDDVREALARLAAIARAHGHPAPARASTDAARCRASLARLRAGAPSSIAIPRIAAGTTVPIRMPAARDAEAWVELLAARGVRAEPGPAFELDDPWIVLALDAAEEAIDRAARALAEIG